MVDSAEPEKLDEAKVELWRTMKYQVMMMMMMIIMMMIIMMMMIVSRCGLTAHSSCITSLAEEHQVCRCVVISSDNNYDDDDIGDDNDDLKVRGP